jgi:hypothetical protein
MLSTNNTCRECEKDFPSERALHAHIKGHGTYLAEYYCKHYPRTNLLTGEPLPFKNKEDYFGRNFRDRGELNKWVKIAKPGDVKDYLLDQLKNRIQNKGLERGPSHLELELAGLPSIDLYKKSFGTYSIACKEAGVKPLFHKGLADRFFEEDRSLKEIEIIVDTREQKPLDFQNPRVLKLDFGDYTATGDNYTKTFVDRKSESDFKSTMCTGFERFRKELQRARDFNAYLYIAVESSIERIVANNNFAAHKSKLPYVWHNMRVLSHEFADNCQFVFTGNRDASKRVILKLLTHGSELWNTDLQYYIDKQSEF